MTSAGRTGVLGGTFDPIHIGHLILAEEARLALSLDRVVFLPAGRPWRKTDRVVTPAEHRFEMVSLAIAGNPYFEVSRAEMGSVDPTYTADTLETLRTAWGSDAKIWFIVGSDALLDLPHWKDPARILSFARLAVASRQPIEPAILDGILTLVPELRSGMDWVTMPAVGISSSDLRGRLRHGTTVRYWLPAAVERYAREQCLYLEGKLDANRR